MNGDKKTQDVVLMGVMAAVIFISTFAIKLPTATGYIHLGDSMVVLAVMLLGARKGALTAGIGGALADLMAGYAVWIVPTFLCKAAMALVIGFLLSHISPWKGRPRWWFSVVLGGLVELIGYFFAGWILYDWPGALGGIIGNIIQITAGTLVAFIVAELLQKSALKRLFIYMTEGNHES